jgi:hypothetical protein
MTSRTPQPLNRFPAIDFEVLNRVAETGRLDITFQTPNMAMNTKFRLLRLIKSLEFYKPNDTLTQVAVLFTIKIDAKRGAMTVLRKDQSPERNAMRAALDAPQGAIASSDLAEAEDAQLDIGFDQMKRSGQFIQNEAGEWVSNPAWIDE